MVKGGPDVVLARCTTALEPDGTVVPIDEVRAAVDAANAELGRRGLRVLAMAVRPMPDDATRRPSSPTRWPRSTTWCSLGLVGIVDPLRPEAVEAVRMAHGPASRCG